MKKGRGAWFRILIPLCLDYVDSGTLSRELLEFHDEACSPSMGSPLLRQITLRNNGVTLKKVRGLRGI